MTFFLQDNNLIFAIAMGLMLGIAFIELISSLGGFAVSHFLDSLMQMDGLHAAEGISAIDGVHVDTMDGVHLDSSHPLDGLHTKEALVHVPILTRFIGWIRFGKVPLLIVIITFLTLFSSIGFIEQMIFFSLTKHYLIPCIAIVIPLLLTIPLVRSVSMVLGKFCIKDETSIVNSSSFIGKVATIVIGTALVGKPTQAKLKDEFDQTHYIMVEPNDVNDSFTEGSQVKLLSQNQSGGLFVAKKFTSN